MKVELKSDGGRRSAAGCLNDVGIQRFWARWIRLTEPLDLTISMGYKRCLAAIPIRSIHRAGSRDRNGRGGDGQRGDWLMRSWQLERTEAGLRAVPADRAREGVREIPACGPLAGQECSEGSGK
ncbi:hypothetical protein IEQ34_011728 [Dendrobium chrysotoxum]|uniref:Uncharacterized protein n=1 Tax=Dendrobium chrysotoxum TaxID=161865 RepID=A0AAV7GTP1_DENCH|nr:hypothetical protein IEQ34_011728 [Dendrobium chrysotoxum]